MALDFAAGCIGGTAGILLGYPFDTVKVMMQTQQPGRPVYTGTIQCIRSIVARESVAGLYRGLSSPLGGVALVNAVVFGVYGNVQKRSADPDSIRSHLFAGTTAGLVQSIITSPMELTKTRMQMQTSSSAEGPKHSGAIDCARHIYRTQGVRGLFRGLSITAARDVPGFASYFVLYELMARAGTSPGAPAGAAQTLMAGGLAGVGSWILTMPIDVVKTRLQVDGTVAGQPARYAGIADCVRQSYAEEGWRFLTRGMSSTLMRAFLMNSVCFYVVALVMHTFDERVDGTQSVVAGLQENVRTAERRWPVVMPLLIDGDVQESRGTRSRREEATALGRSAVYLSALSDAVMEQEIVELEEDVADEMAQGYYGLTLSLLDEYDGQHQATGAEDQRDAFLRADERLRIDCK